MKPVDVGEPNDPAYEKVTYAKDQPEYIPLPVVRNLSDPLVPVVSVWEPDRFEIEDLKKMIELGRVRISLQQCVCLNPATGLPNPLQPVRLVIGEIVSGTIANANEDPIPVDLR